MRDGCRDDREEPAKLGDAAGTGKTCISIARTYHGYRYQVPVG
jgi:hypothetical protein